MPAFPEMKILIVDAHQCLTFPQLIHLYSIGQMAPGLNMMMIVLIGQWAGGILGAIAVLGAGIDRVAVGRLCQRGFVFSLTASSARRRMAITLTVVH